MFRAKIVFWILFFCVGVFAAVPSIDVSKIDSKTKLDGEWAYAYGKTVPPSLVDTLPDRFQIPGQINKKDISQNGCATFAVDLNVTAGKPLSIDLRRPMSVWKIFIDDELIAQSGQMDVKNGIYKASMTRGAFGFTPQKDTVRLTVWLANSQHEYFGISDSPVIAPTGMLEKARMDLTIIEIFIIGILFSAGMYHIGLFVVYKKERVPLWFGIFCLVLAVRTSTTGAKVITYAFENISWEAVVRTEYISGYALLSIFVFYLGSLYEKQSNKKIEYTFLALSLIYISFVILGSTVFFTSTLYTYEFLVLAFIIFTMWLLYRSFKAKEQSSTFALIAFLLFAATILHDLLMFSKVIDDSKDLFPIGFLAYLAAQAAILLRRYADAFKALEKHSEELESTVAKRTQDLKNLLKQRELLLRELSHRVKNNLQFIIGLLWIKKTKNDTKTNEILSTLQSQIQAIATVHETLCLQPNIATLNGSEYIKTVVGSLAEIYESVNFEYECKSESVLSVDDSISVGLIINELAANSIKHAFGGGNGKIKVSFITDDAFTMLIYTDYKSYFDINFFNTESNSKKSIGWSMISELTQQLKADMSVDGQNIIIKFATKEKA